MTFKVTACLFALATGFPVVAAEPAIKLPDREHFHLYLLIGQSNMAGRGPINPQDKVPHPRVLRLTKDNRWAPAADPLHFDKPAIAGVGLGSTFGRVMAEADPGVTIGLVPCAVGGTPLSRWQKGGDLYQQAVERTRAAMQDGTLRGILWHQGESDAANEDTARSYGERLGEMVGDLRKELRAGEVPFVAGQLGEFLRRQSKDGTRSYWPLVNEQIASLPRRVARTAVVSSSGLKHKGDEVHFDSPSLRELGKRYAKAMQDLRAGEDTTARRDGEHRVFVVGHRGLMHSAPENTLAAFRACLALRVGFEFDVRRTMDAQLVCLHDETLDRTTSGTGKLNELALAELRRLDAGSWFDDAFGGERVPQVTEILAIAAEQATDRTFLAVDLKETGGGVEAAVVRMAVEHGVLDRLVFIGAAIDSPDVRARLRAASAKAQVAHLADGPEKLADAIADESADWVYLRYLPPREEVDRIHRAGKRVFLAGPLVAGNLPENWAKAADLGIDAILTDYPLELERQLRRHRSSQSR